MVQTTLDTIDELLEGALEDVEGPEARFKIRSARQLVIVAQNNSNTLDVAVRSAVDDETILSTLRDLGYIE